eukprot:GEZU01025409.1.p1 GENE.GEZU01025409.1~~GEZU01025409.1.p1  ORF type:complete len:157 (-),score=36.31 GEZU01025409.1:59-481(-)
MEAALKNLVSENQFQLSVIFDGEGTIIASTLPSVEDKHKTEAIQLTTAFDDYTTTMGKGVVFNNKHYAVHRFYPENNPPLIYGRAAESEGDGFVLSKVVKSGGSADNKKDLLFVFVSYALPTVSANAIPKVIKFCTEVLA